MNRSLYCRDCGQKSIQSGLHPEDSKAGWTWRWHYVSTVVPKGHGMTLITGDTSAVFEGKGKREFHPLSELLCDQCGEPITGQIAVARTMWKATGIFREQEPPLWENDYGHILPAEAVAVADALEDGKQHGKP